MKNNGDAPDMAPPGDNDTDENLTKTLSPEIVMSLEKYNDGDYITKIGRSEAFGCTERTLQRMVERLEIPPPMLLAGRKVWIVGKVRAWLAEAAARKEAEALKEARRLRVFDL